MNESGMSPEETKRLDVSYRVGVENGYAQAVTEYADRTRDAVIRALRSVAQHDYDPADKLADAIENGAEW